MKRFDLALAALLRAVCMVCLVLLFLAITASIVNRVGGFMSMGWSDELIELLFAWLVFLGTASLWRDGAHFRIDLLERRLAGRRGGQVLALLLQLLSMAFIATLTWQAWQLAVTASDDSPVFAISKKYWYGVIPVAGVIMLGYSLRDAMATLRSRPLKPTP